MSYLFVIFVKYFNGHAQCRRTRDQLELVFQVRDGQILVELLLAGEAVTIGRDVDIDDALGHDCVLRHFV